MPLFTTMKKFFKNVYWVTFLCKGYTKRIFTLQPHEFLLDMGNLSKQVLNNFQALLNKVIILQAQFNFIRCHSF